LCAYDRTPFFSLESRQSKKLGKKEILPGETFGKSNQKPGVVCLIPVKGKLAKISCVKYDLLMELSPVGFFQPECSG
jgi:hypothetical protein